jgi:hypothetical protein
MVVSPSNHRLFAVFGLTVLLVGLCLFAKFNHPWISLNECLSNPERYDGKRVWQFREPRVGKIEKDGFWLIQRQGPTVFVNCDTTGLKENSYLGMVAVFRKPDMLEAERIQLSPKRREKMATSLVPALIIVILLIRAFTVDRKDKVVRPRNHA